MWSSQTCCAFGTRMNIQEEWKAVRICRRLYKLSFHAVKKSTTAEGGALTLKRFLELTVMDI